MSYYLEDEELAAIERWAKLLNRSRSWVLRMLVRLGDRSLVEENERRGVKRDG